MRWPMASVVLVCSTLIVPLPAQRGSGGTRGGMTAGFRSGSGDGVRPGVPRQPFGGNSGFRPSANRHGHIGVGYGAYWIPSGYPWDDLVWDSPYWYDNGYSNSPSPDTVNASPPQNGSSAPVVVIISKPQQPAPEPPKLIEVAAAERAPQPASQLPTIFALANGERLEARQYTLTVNSLYIVISRERRVLSLDALDLEKTIALNHARGIDIKVPENTYEIFIGF